MIEYLWIRGHWVGVLASFLTEEDDCAERAENVLLACFEDENFLILLPPSTLHLLLHGFDHRGPGLKRALAARRPEIEAALNAVESIVTDSRILAAQILFSMSSASALMQHRRRLSTSATRDRGKREAEKDESRLQALEHRFETLRTPSEPIKSRREAAVQIAGLLYDEHNYAQRGQLVNVLCSALYAWPLLVLPAGKTAISLPISIDIKARNSADEFSVVHASMRVKVNAWHDSLLRAVRAAKRELKWANPAYFQNIYAHSILQPEVVFDFELVAYLAEWLSPIVPALELTDRSAEGYLSQAVLARFLGATPASTSIATGSLQENPDGDYEFIAPGGIPQKLSWVFASRVFERVILPEKCLDDPEVNSAILRAPGGSKHINIHYAPNSRALTKIMQRRGWGARRYLRCPEIPALLRALRAGTPNNPPPNSKLIDEVVEMVRAGESIEDWTEKTVSAEHVARALDQIDGSRRGRGRALRWHFLRVVPAKSAGITWREDYSSLWHIIAMLCGMNDRQALKLLSAFDVESAAGNLAALLNQSEPDISAESVIAAPDVLVLIGADQLAELGPYRASPYHARSLFPVLRSKLVATTPLLGRTRIILLRDAQRSAGKANGEDDRRRLVELSTFVGGFSYQAGAALLSQGNDDEAGEPPRDVLKRLRASKRIGLDGAQYFLLHEWTGTPSTQADSMRHYRAGVALAPAAVDRGDKPRNEQSSRRGRRQASGDGDVGRQRQRGVALDNVALPHIANEARFQFEVARQLGNDTLMKSAKAAASRVLRHSALPTWDTARELERIGDRNWADEIYEKIVDGNSNSIDPFLAVAAARAAIRRGDGGTSRGEWISDANKLLRSAQAKMTTPQAQLIVISWLGFLISKYSSGTPDEIAPLAQRTREILAADNTIDSSGTSAAWLEIIADEEQSDMDAFLLYKKNVSFFPGMTSSKIKAIGSAKLAGIQANIPVELDDRALAWCVEAYRGELRDHVLKRWKAALPDEIKQKIRG